MAPNVVVDSFINYTERSEDRYVRINYGFAIRSIRQRYVLVRCLVRVVVRS